MTRSLVFTLIGVGACIGAMIAIAVSLSGCRLTGPRFVVLAVGGVVVLVGCQAEPSR
jgi:hypothetical protein